MAKKLEELAIDTQEPQEKTEEQHNAEATVLGALRNYFSKMKPEHYTALVGDSLDKALLALDESADTAESASPLSVALLQAVRQSIESLLDIYREIYNSPGYNDLKADVEAFEQKLFSQRIAERASNLSKEQEESAITLFPDIAEWAAASGPEFENAGPGLLKGIILTVSDPVINEMRSKKPQYKDLSNDEIVRQMLETPWAEAELFAELIATINEWATDILNDVETVRAIEALGLDKEQPADFVRLTINQTDRAEWALDAISRSTWATLKEADKSGQVAFNLPSKKGTSAAIFYSVNYSGLPAGIAKRLTSYDRLVLSALASIYNAGNEYTTIPEIYRHMGYTGNPSNTDRKKITDSLIKLQSVSFTLDNQQEIRANLDYPHFTYHGAIAPLEFVVGEFKGGQSEAVVHLFREPPLHTFARQRKQITAFPVALLTAPVSKTEKTLNLYEYLIDRIAHMKNDPKAPKKMLYSTINKNCSITTQKQAQRSPETIKKILLHFKEKGWIKDFKQAKDSVTIVL